MYESPIEIMVGEMVTKMEQDRERCVISYLQKEGINVDKKELIRALRHERNQYRKGYLDGKNDVLDNIRDEIEAIEEGILSYHNDRPWVFKDEVLEIIDKYKACEDKE